jgi:hypothetical protein
MSYCGCGTKTNKVRWVASVLLFLLGVGLLVGYLVEAANCKVCEDTGVSGTAKVCRKVNANDGNVDGTCTASARSLL